MSIPCSHWKTRSWSVHALSVSSPPSHRDRYISFVVHMLSPYIRRVYVLGLFKVHDYLRQFLYSIHRIEYDFMHLRPPSANIIAVFIYMTTSTTTSLDLRRDKKDARHAWLMDGSVVVRGCAPRRRGCSGTCLRRNGSRGLSSIVFVRALRSISLPLSPRGEHGVRREQSVCWRHELGHHFRRVAGAF